MISAAFAFTVLAFAIAPATSPDLNASFASVHAELIMSRPLFAPSNASWEMPWGSFFDFDSKSTRL